MKAAYYEQVGDAKDVFRIGEVPTPTPGPGEVRVRVVVSGVNPSDTKRRAGWGGPMNVPMIIPHQDGAGIIDSVGPGVPETRVGERVWIYEALVGGTMGTAAQFTVLPSANAVKMDDAVSFEAGASIGLPGLTAYHLLFDERPLEGLTVLVQGGGGSVGGIAIQLAIAAGARVIATAGSDDRVQYARNAGAEFVVNSQTDDVVARIRDYTGEDTPIDRVIEGDFVRNFATSVELLKTSGVISVLMVSNDHGVSGAAIDFNALVIKDATVHFAMVFGMSSEKRARGVDFLNAALRNGDLRPSILRQFAIDDIASAHDFLGIAGAGGKVLIKLD
ncbi:MAG: NADPH:quinone reductase [Brevundimonas sp.]